MFWLTVDAVAICLLIAAFGLCVRRRLFSLTWVLTGIALQLAAAALTHAWDYFELDWDLLDAQQRAFNLALTLQLGLVAFGLARLLRLKKVALALAVWVISFSVAFQLGSARGAFAWVYAAFKVFTVAMLVLELVLTVLVLRRSRRAGIVGLVVAFLMAALFRGFQLCALTEVLDITDYAVHFYSLALLALVWLLWSRPYQLTEVFWRPPPKGRSSDPVSFTDDVEAFLGAPMNVVAKVKHMSSNAKCGACGFGGPIPLIPKGFSDAVCFLRDATSDQRTAGWDCEASFFTSCPTCQTPIVVASPVKIESDHGSVVVREASVSGTVTWPTALRAFDRAGVPAGVRSDLREAAKCIANQCYRGAGALIRRALEHALAEYATRTKLVASERDAAFMGLNKLISTLGREGMLGPDDVRKANTVRWLGNTSAHSMDETVTAQDVEDAWTVCIHTLEAIYTSTAKLDRLERKFKPT